MDWNIFEATEINSSTIFVRMLISMILGGILGWERESRRQNAGLRTNIIICLGSTLLMLVSIFIPQTFSDFQNGDPGRIAAQVVSGIGFLGAGAIFRLGGTTRGLTTAATIWAVAAVGLAVGAGMYLGAIIGTFVILFVLIIVGKIENNYFPEGSLKILEISFQGLKMETDKIFAILDRHEIDTKNINVLQSRDKKKSKIQLYVFVPEKVNIKKLYNDFNELHQVAQISLGQDFKNIN
ncbi:MAG: MgtC/SapB family protein [Bacteroidota bacterium]|nr:MgtC/SapB family protein [Bacteroidota bacterium]